MTRFARRAMLGFLTASMSANVTAQVQKPPASKVVWNLDWSEPHCMVSTGELETVGLSLMMMPGSLAPGLFMASSAGLIPKSAGSRTTITLLPAGKTFEADVVQYPEAKGVRAIAVDFDVPQPEFMAAFAQSSELGVMLSGQPIRVSIKGAKKATDALQQCVDMKLPEWGIDPATLAALKQPPTPLFEKTHWLMADDYPDSALQAGKSGDVVARLTVSAIGTVSDCAVVISSGSTALDKVTCEKARARARYNPAIGADGQPTASPVMVHVKWRMLSYR